MVKRIAVMLAVLIAFVALPVFGMASYIVTDVLLSHTDMQGGFYNSSGQSLPCMISDGDSYRHWSGPGVSSTDVYFSLINTDGSPLFYLPDVPDFVISFDLDAGRVLGNASSPSETRFEIVLNGSTGTKVIEGIGIPDSVDVSSKTAYYAFSFDSADYPAFLEYDSVQSIMFHFTWISGATGTEISVYDILSKRAYDQLIDGNGTPLAPNKNEDLDNAGQEISDLENNALGGKTDEEIVEEVDSALSFDVDSLDTEAQAGISGFFDGLLVVFGVDYQSLMLLALSLGLAAFIIGRRYKAG